MANYEVELVLQTTKWDREWSNTPAHWNNLPPLQNPKPTSEGGAGAGFLDKVTD